jgi:iduronate 2-sulfatase
MNQNILLKQFSLILLIISFTVKPWVGDSQVSPKYNVLFIAVDDMNDRINFLGNSEVVSPNLQRLVARGMVFKRAYSQYPLCNPSRTSLLSGWRPDKTGIINNTVRPRSVMGPNVKFLPEYFKQYGYHTERYGKIMHGQFEADITWDFAEPAEGGGGGDITAPKGAIYPPYTGKDWWIEDVPDDSLHTGIMARDLVARMQQPQITPFFYALGLTAHHPFNPSLKYWNLNGDPSVQELLPIDANRDFTDLKGNGSEPIILPSTPPGDRNDIPASALTGQWLYNDSELKRVVHAYDAKVSQTDAQLGLVLDEMDRQNLWENTIVVFWSDHGQHLGEHEGLWGKLTLFEESLHIPLIVCVPGKSAGECSKLVELVDLYPTLAELCGLPPPSGMEGTSFAPLLDNPTLTWKRAIFSQVSRSKGRSVHTEQYHYNSWGANGEELYDHNTDPHEYTNLAGKAEYTDVLNQMKNILSEGWTKSVPPPQCPDPQTFYADNDGDGYGNPLTSIQACSVPAGFVADNRDCSDNNAAVHPNAVEICNGIDDNCNGETDEGGVCNGAPIITASGPTSNLCPGTSVTLTCSPSSSYLWSTGATTQSIAVTVAGSYKVTANGITSASTDVSFLACGSPTSLVTSNIASTTVTLKWGAVSCAARYLVRYRKLHTTTWTNVNVTTNTANITGLTRATTYQWQVQTICVVKPKNASAFAKVATFTTGAALTASSNITDVSVKTDDQDWNVLVYPNPAKNSATLRILGSVTGVSVRISDIAGKLLWQTENTTSTQINMTLEKLSSGIYLITVTDGKHTKVVKLVKE